MKTSPGGYSIVDLGDGGTTEMAYSVSPLSFFHHLFVTDSIWYLAHASLALLRVERNQDLFALAASALTHA